MNERDLTDKLNFQICELRPWRLSSIGALSSDRSSDYVPDAEAFLSMGDHTEKLAVDILTKRLKNV